MSDDPDCLGMCAIDDDVCTGCGRTLDQINKARGDDDEEEAPPRKTTGVAAAGDAASPRV